MGARWVRPLAWIILVLVTGFWLWFGIAAAAGERLGAVNGVMHIMVPGGLLAATAAIAWRSPSVGATLLILEGVLVAIGYPLIFGGRFPISTVIMVLLTLAALPAAAGCLLLAARRSA